MGRFRIFRRIFLLIVLVSCLYITASANTLITEREVFHFLTEDMGLPTSSACGVLANIEHESSFRPNVVGDKGTSYGLCQWHNSRFSALISYCKGIGSDYRTVSGQLQYLKYELETSYVDLLAALRVMENTPNGAYKAGYLWCIQFERPADAEIKAANRGNLARGKYWNRYNSLLIIDTQRVELPSLEEIEQVIINREVVMAQPPETYPEPEGESGDQSEPEKNEPVLPLLAYVPRRLSKSVPERQGDPALGYAVAVLFAPLSDGKKERFVLCDPQFEEIAV